MNHFQQLDPIMQVVTVAIGIPVTLFLIYMVTRVISSAFANSWWDAKVNHTKKFLDLFKDNSPKGPEGKNGNA